MQIDLSSERDIGLCLQLLSYIRSYVNDERVCLRIAEYAYQKLVEAESKYKHLGETTVRVYLQITAKGIINNYLQID